MNPDFKIALEWDVGTWSKALKMWESAIAEYHFNLSYGLETGARNGGLSWYFAKKYGSNMICSDLEAPGSKAISLHHSAGLAQLISYEICDTTALPYDDERFDFVMFKSVLGAVGRNNQPELQQKAIREMYRVLKPGGVLFFAENLSGTAMHRLARQHFVPWGNRWRYVSLREMHYFFRVFPKFSLRSTGFLSAFTPGDSRIKSIVSRMDVIQHLVPANWRYVGYGWAVKE